MMSSSDNDPNLANSAHAEVGTNSLNCVYLIAGETEAFQSVQPLLSQTDYAIKQYASIFEFMHDADGLPPGIVLTDQTRASISVAACLEELFKLPHRFRVIVFTAYPNTALTVAAMKAGALTVIGQPLDRRVLLEAVDEGFRQIQSDRSFSLPSVNSAALLDSLSPRELEVIHLVYDGLTNKAISIRLGISIKTVERHRSKAMHKLQVSSLAELIRMISRR